MRYSKEEINKRFQMLPEQVQDIVLSTEVVDAIKKITEKNNLHIDTAGLLNEEITYVMVGAEKSANFINNLKTKVRLPENKINAIAGDVNEKIFLPIRESLKRVANATAQNTIQKTDEVETKISQNPLQEKETELQNQINHLPLTESEEIKEQVQAYQETKPQAPPPANLPIEEEVSKLSEGYTSKPSEDTGKPEERHIQKQSPYAKDPYREPID